jgi:hypothetical protein
LGFAIFFTLVHGVGIELTLSTPRLSSTMLFTTGVSTSMPFYARALFTSIPIWFYFAAASLFTWVSGDGSGNPLLPECLAKAYADRRQHLLGVDRAGCHPYGDALHHGHRIG